MAVVTALSIILAFCIRSNYSQSNQILSSLNNVISSSYLLQHDFLRCFSNGDFKDMQEAASIFASNHFKYSQNFANYLQTVADKIDDEHNKQEIVEPIMKEMDEELGIYGNEEMNKLTQIGIDQKWYNKIPHKYLNKRFFDSLNIDKTEPEQNELSLKQSLKNKDKNKPEIQIESASSHDTISPQSVVMKDAITTNTDAGDSFTQFMIQLYDESNPCISLGIMGYTEIGLIIQKIYHQIWNGLRDHTKLTDDQIVIFPLHAIIDNAKSVKLIKESFEKYMKQNPDSCKYEDIEQVIRTVLKRRIKMYDDIRAQIENKQNYYCKQPYYSVNTVNDTEENVITLSNKMVITNLVETDSKFDEYSQRNEYIEYIQFIDRRYIAIFIHIIGYLYIILHDVD